MTSNSSQQVALVTGGSGGIGLGITQGLIAEGFKVAMTGRNQEKGERIAAELSPDGNALFIKANALEQTEVEAAVDQTAAWGGRIDLLVNNSGGSSGYALVHELTDEAWQQALTWNLTSVFWSTRRALPHMLKEGSGCIINISSVQGKQANRPNTSHYISSKHGVNGFTKAVAREYGAMGITSNAICVGAVETDLMREVGPKAASAAGLTYEEYKQRYAEQAMTGRLNTVSEVAAMAVLLASPHGKGITGAILNVDGGTCPY
jgi:3-hydroxybutyrate dehydrogenase